MAANVDATGEPIPTSAVLMAASKHIGEKCFQENVAFLKCKKKDPNPEKCLEKGREVTRCVFGLLRDLHQRCTKEMDDYLIILVVCITTQTSLIFVARSRNHSRKHVL